jgi:1-acyl-sn-glycerol-3-phosphate acyltransferase
MLNSLFVLFFLVLLGVPVGLIGIPFTLITGNVMPMYRAGMWIAAFGMRIGGVRIIVTGRENIPAGQPCIFMANHVSNLDPPVILPLLPGRTSVLLKQSLMSIPILGYAMRLGGFVPIDTTRHEDMPHEEARRIAMRNVERAADALRSGTSITIFPEGSRSPDGHIKAFKKGGFYLAADTGAPIVPVSISGTFEMMPNNTLRLRRGTARVTFHPAIVPPANANRDALMHEVRAAILSGLPPEMQ